MNYSSSTDSPTDKQLNLDPIEIDDLLSKTLIANLATTDNDGGIHIVPMWFLRIGDDICIPTSQRTHKYRNLQARPHASVMVDISLEGLNLRGVLIRGKVEIVTGEEARIINHSIHLKYVKPESLNDFNVANYLSKGDDITLKIHMDKLVSWNLADSKAGMALRTHNWAHQLDAR